MSYIADKVWKDGSGVFTIAEIVEDLKTAIKNKDKESETTLKNLLIRLGAEKHYPEYFL